ncbi:hypothetical protein MKW98_015137 [Papaver atlanticum]|uniref:TF-B3 domain-containing protein n=1 Tax=Papaver atlanticum TaxID=357466 RepID=A0AAD4XAL5_9MAGN|nr:hypothetical protein MKW98_015137 [Papaver atlanticum]
MATEEEIRMAAGRAERFRLSLGDAHLSFAKRMITSHVYCGFWLSLPRKFCADYLPNHDAKVTLVDEIGVEYETRYLHFQQGLSSGWRGFSLDHGLLPGDTCVFQLAGPTIFRVYIFRARDV